MGFVVAERQFARLHSRVRFSFAQLNSLRINKLRPTIYPKNTPVRIAVIIDTSLYCVVIHPNLAKRIPEIIKLRVPDAA
jgi:hypothetical protein